MREPAWHVTATGDNVALAAAQAASAGQKHVVTGIYAGFNNAATAGIVTVTVGIVTVLTLHFIGQIALNNLALEFASSVNAAVGITLTASGAPGTFGSVLLNGFTK